MDKTWFDTVEAALNKAKEELSYATYLEDCGVNAGIRKINSNKTDWLKLVIYLAEIGLEVEKKQVAPAAVEESEVLEFIKQIEEDYFSECQAVAEDGYKAAPDSAKYFLERFKEKYIILNNK